MGSRREAVKMTPTLNPEPDAVMPYLPTPSMTTSIDDGAQPTESA